LGAAEGSEVVEVGSRSGGADVKAAGSSELDITAQKAKRSGGRFQARAHRGQKPEQVSRVSAHRKVSDNMIISKVDVVVHIHCQGPTMRFRTPNLPGSRKEQGVSGKIIFHLHRSSLLTTEAVEKSSQPVELRIDLLPVLLRRRIGSLRRT
jgi:hypothetical protein